MYTVLSFEPNAMSFLLERTDRARGPARQGARGKAAHIVMATPAAVGPGATRRWAWGGGRPHHAGHRRHHGARGGGIEEEEEEEEGRRRRRS